MADAIPAHVEHLAQDIAAYLSGNPHAADTVPGIRNWWLSDVTPGVSHDDVENAIGILMQRGALECRTLPDGTRIYAATPTSQFPPRAGHG